MLRARYMGNHSTARLALAALLLVGCAASAQAVEKTSSVTTAAGGAASEAQASELPRKMRYAEYLKTYGAPVSLDVKDLIPRPLAQVLVYQEPVKLARLDVDALAAQHKVQTIIFRRDVQIQGNLLQPETDFGPTLVFLGSMGADNAFFGGSWVQIAGDLRIRNLLVGDYNHGALRVAGKTEAYMVYNSDYSMGFGKGLLARYHLGSEQPDTLSPAQASQLFIAPVWRELLEQAEGDPDVFGAGSGEVFLPYLTQGQNPLQRPATSKR